MMDRARKKDDKFYDEVRKQRSELGAKMAKNKYSNQKKTSKSKRNSKSDNLSSDVYGFPMIPFQDQKGTGKHGNNKLSWS